MDIEAAGKLAAAEARVAVLEAAIRGYLKEYPCPGMHTTFGNIPGRCPEESADPEEWCMSARFNKALAGTEQRGTPAPEPRIALLTKLWDVVSRAIDEFADGPPTMKATADWANRWVREMNVVQIEATAVTGTPAERPTRDEYLHHARSLVGQMVPGLDSGTKAELAIAIERLMVSASKPRQLGEGGA